jgi:hypothetical protein
VNPGTVGGVGAPATWVLGDLESLGFEVIDVVAGRYREPSDLDSI